MDDRNYEDKNWQAGDGTLNNGESGKVHKEEKVVERVVEREKKNNSLGTVSLVTGILALVLTFCCPVIDIALAIVAIITGIIGYRDGQDYSLAGLILGIVAMAIYVLGILGIVSVAILEEITRGM